MRRSGVAVLGLAAIGAFMGLYQMALTRYDFGAAAGELPQAIRDYRTAGLPWTVADIEASPQPEENAALPLQQAMAALPGSAADTTFGEAFRLGGGDPAPYRAALRLAHEAAKRPKLNFHRDWDQGANLAYPEFAHLKWLCRAFAASAHRRAIAGDDAGALRDLEDGRRLAVLTESEPSWMAVLSGAACEKLVLTGTQRCLSEAAGDAGRLSLYRDWLAKPVPLPDLKQALRGETYRTLAMVRNFDKAGIGRRFFPQADTEAFVSETGLNFPPTPRRDGVPGNLRSKAYMARCLQAWTQLSRATNGFDTTPELFDLHVQGIQQQSEHAVGMSHQFDTILSPNPSQLFRANQRILASRVVTSVLAEAMLRRAQGGGWPVSVATLDPFTGKPMGVRFDGRQFRVWSVGRNGKDDGGLSRTEAREQGKESDDEVAAYPLIQEPVVSKGPPTVGVPMHK